ncbi:xylanase [Thelonectria olida]|uniref:endo-1,4-beta-xylanase n=1 Tax=Thelonectria olida TaxID=1576542 RepID=A0A9P8VRN5_9HYPO|nr:xylanase [Thelonectria olida]
MPSCAQIVSLFLSVAGVLAAPAPAPKRSTVFSSSQDGVDSAGFYYSPYNDNGAAATYTEFNSGQFQLGWNLPSSTEFLGGKGCKIQTPKQVRKSFFYATGDYTLAVYWWTTNPHGTGTPGNGNILGQVYSDGGTFDVYDLYYPNVPEVYGATSFHQYWSVRRSSRATGTATTGNHFQGWKNLGLNPGYTVFQMVTAEGFKGTGYLDFAVSYS